MYIFYILIALTGLMSFVELIALISKKIKFTKIPVEVIKIENAKCKTSFAYKGYFNNAAFIRTEIIPVELTKKQKEKYIKTNLYVSSKNCHKFISELKFRQLAIMNTIILICSAIMLFVD